MTEQTALTIHEASHLMPAMSMANAADRFNQLATFTKRIMKDGIDFGVIPGTSDKPVLLKPGAEKLTTFFGLSVRYEVIEKVEDWTGADHAGEPFFYYWFRCQLWRGDLLIAEADGSCNSMESKYRWRWVGEDDLPQGTNKESLKARRGSISEFTFAVDKAETAGQYGKPADYWQQFKDAIAAGTATKGKRTTRAGKEYDTWEIDTTVYRVPNEDVFSQVNTVQKMAQKRALVAATLLAVNASEYYTQDLEDLVIEGSFTVSKPDNGDGNGHQRQATPAPRPEPQPEPEPFEGIPTNHAELFSALQPLGYYNHGKHMLHALNKIDGQERNTWPMGDQFAEFYAGAFEKLTAYAKEQRAQEAQDAIKDLADQKEMPF